ncbi:MAG: formylglycine-generating enzyme family protein [Nitrospinota bacterium]|jgi:formylglycine-generating enzyme required for sulfatase activity|nr:formylglycine-generating enzyme family protein [Nitrospinota bacterium]
MDNNKKENMKIPENMVLVPEGPFLMGSTKQDIDDVVELEKNIENSRLENEIPQREVFLNAYLMDKYSVTNAEFKKFIEAGGYLEKNFWSEDGWKHISEMNPTESDDLKKIVQADDDTPVVNISWYEAEAFAKWAGKRLPTEAEWEKAARGTDGRIYPWGNKFDKTMLNCAEAKHKKSTPVSKFTEGKSIYGCFDMVGNVWEWTTDWYDSDYYSSAPSKNPVGPMNAEKNPYYGKPENVGISIYDFESSTKSESLTDCRVIRGGSWNGSGVAHVRCANRDYDEPTFKNDIIGFRCAKSINEAILH